MPSFPPRWLVALSWALLVLSFWLYSPLASAQAQCWTFRVGGAVPGGTHYVYDIDPAAACSAWLSYVLAQNFYTNGIPTSAEMTVPGAGDGQDPGDCRLNRPAPYSPDFVDAVGLYQNCPNNACLSQAGISSTRNFTAGYTNVGAADQGGADIRGLVSPLNLQSDGSDACHDDCRVIVGKPAAVWVAENPTPQGLYRVSIDYVVTHTGGQCATENIPPTEALSPTAPPAPCDGYTGTVGDKSVCIPHIAPSSESKPSTPGGGATIGNPPAGSSGEGAPGSRTPDAGNGGPEGGPKGPGSGGKVGGGVSVSGGGTGGGTTNVEVNVETCGIPGKPKCALDETGTPSELPGDMQGKAAEMVSGDAALRDIFNGGIEFRGPQTREALGWAFGIELPAAVCSPWQVWTPSGPQMLSVCDHPVILLMRQLLGWFLAVLAGLYAWRRLTGAW